MRDYFIDSMSEFATVSIYSICDFCFLYFPQLRIVHSKKIAECCICSQSHNQIFDLVMVDDYINIKL